METGIADFVENPAEQTGESFVREIFDVPHVAYCISGNLVLTTGLKT